MKQSEMVAAIAKCNQLIAQNPEKAELHARLGNLYAQQKQWQEAIASYQRAIKIDSTIGRVYYNLANILSQIGEMKKAANNLYQGLQLEPSLADYQKHCALAELLQSQQRPDKAIICFRTAIALKPDFLPAYQHLGELLTKQGRKEEALATYYQGMGQNPQNPQFHVCLAHALAARQRWRQARDRYQRALDLNPKLAIAYYGKGVVLCELEQYSEAIAAYQQAIKLQPKYWEAYHQLGMVWQQQQQWSKAVNAYEKVRELNPQFILSLQRLSEVYSTLDKYDSAIDCYHKLVEIAPKGSKIEQEALENYQKTIKTISNPTPQLYERLGKLLRAKSYFSEALTAFQKAIAINPNFGSAHNAIQYTPASPEDLDRLIKFYRNLVKDRPQIPLAWGNLGDALTQKNRASKAIDCYRKSSYQKAVNQYSELANLDWKEKKESPPDFIIIGASKSGTSSLYNYLSYHPQILLPHKKEIDFFLRYFDRGIDWYLAHFPTITDRLDFITGEATPNYLRFPVVPQRIKKYCHGVKLIVLLRNPVDRAVSWHYHKVNSGLATGDLATAIASELERLQHLSEADLIKGGYHNTDNLLSSLYIYQLKTWLELLGREQFLILKSEEFYSNTAAVMKQVFDFLGIPDHQLQNYPQVNVGSYDPIDANLRTTLVEYFQPYNQQLEEYLGIKFNWD